MQLRTDDKAGIDQFRAGVHLGPRQPRRQGPRTVLDPVAAEAWRTGSRPTHEIASDLGLKPSTLRQRMKKHGVPRTPFSAGPTLSQQAYDLFKGGMSLKKVAKALGISRQAAGVNVTRARMKDPNPYYRQKSRQGRGG